MRAASACRSDGVGRVLQPASARLASSSVAKALEAAPQADTAGLTHITVPQLATVVGRQFVAVTGHQGQAGADDGAVAGRRVAFAGEAAAAGGEARGGDRRLVVEFMQP